MLTGHEQQILKDLDWRNLMKKKGKILWNSMTVEVFITKTPWYNFSETAMIWQYAMTINLLCLKFHRTYSRLLKDQRVWWSALLFQMSGIHSQVLGSNSWKQPARKKCIIIQFLSILLNKLFSIFLAENLMYNQFLLVSTNSTVLNPVLHKNSLTLSHFSKVSTHLPTT